MRYTSSIDNVTALRWGLNINLAYLFSWVYALPSWAKPMIIEDRTYYFAAKTKAVEELPLLTTKTDTMYRYYKQLEEMGLIHLQRVANKDYISLTEKAKEWNTKLGSASEQSDGSGSEVGQKSELRSDEIPTYKNTIIDKTTNDNTLASESILTIEDRKEKFRRSVIEDGSLLYTKKMLEEFFGYWSEKNRAKNPKMRFERETSWELPRRMRTWAEKGDRKYPSFLTDEERTLAQKRKDFATKLYDYLEKKLYTREVLNQFYAYWTMPENVPNPQYLRFEKEEFWDLSQRLMQWNERNNKKTPNAK